MAPGIHRQLSPRRGSERPSAQRIAASMRFQSPGFEFFALQDTQKRMLTRLGQLRGEPITLPFRYDQDALKALIRHFVRELNVADHKAQPTSPETWAQAFERVHGEALE
jgi:hypothetical protein